MGWDVDTKWDRDVEGETWDEGTWNGDDMGQDGGT